MEDIFLINEISNRLKELSKFSDKKDMDLQDLADKVSTLLDDIEDNIYAYKREKCKTIKQEIKSYPIGK